MADMIISAQSEEARRLPLYLNSLCENYVQPTIKRRGSEWNFHQILFVLEGRGTLACDGQILPLKKGNAFFTRMYTDCEYANEGGLITAFLTVKGDAVNLLADFYKCKNLLFIENANIESYVSDIKAIRQEYEGARRECILSAKCYSFFADFFEHTKSETLSTTDKITAYINKNFAERLTLHKLSTIFGCSISKLCHDFKARHGTSLFNYIINLRLSYAREVIKNTPAVSTQAVSLQSGFDDVSYFCKAYKKRFGRTPMQDKIF